MAASIVRSDKEEEQWLNAALMVLQQAHRPMHYTNIKRLILEKGLVASGLKTTLEAALCKEAECSSKRLQLVSGQPGVFALVKSHNQMPAGTEKKLPQLQLNKRAPLPITGEKQHPAIVSIQQPTNGVSAEKTKPSSSANAIKKLVKPSLDPVASVSLVNVVSHQKPVDEAAKYEEKYRKLKRFVKEMIFLNAAYCDEITRIEEKVIRVKEERRYLLRRLFQHQASTAPSSNTAPRASTTVSSQGAAYSSFASSVPSQFSAVFQSISAAAPGAQSAGNSSTARPSSQSIAQLLGEADKRRKKMTSKKRPLSEHGVRKDGDNETTASRVKKSRQSHAKQHISPLPLDSTGRPILPIELGALTIYSLGEIVPKPGYHTTEHIYPVGFCSTRLFTAIAGHTPNCLYTCKVSDSGTAARFEISTEDVSDKTFVGSTPSECQRQLFEAINASRGPGAVPLDSDIGADFFGLSHPTVQYLIQSCPKARSCANYQWTKFEVGRRNELPEIRVDDKASVAAAILETMQGTPVSLASSLLQLQHTEQLNIKVEPV